MLKNFLYLLIPLSLWIHPASAKNCGTGMGIFWQMGSAGVNSFMTGVHTSASSGNVAGELNAVINGNMSCEPDYTLGDGSSNAVSRMLLRLSNGLRCENSTTVSINSVPGLQWNLSGMVCQNGELLSNTTKTVPWDQHAQWSDGTIIGTAKLVVRRAFWEGFGSNNQRVVQIPTPSFGMTLENSPNINVGSVIGASKQMNMIHQGTCSMSLSTDNLNFGRLTPTDINNKVTKEFRLDYSCTNRGASNGIYLKFEPEYVVNASQGTFSAKDKSGKSLIFKIGAPNSYKDPIPLNSLWQIIAPSESNVTNSVNVYVQPMPSTPFPSGSVSTYLNISLIYR